MRRSLANASSHTVKGSGCGKNKPQCGAQQGGRYEAKSVQPPCSTLTCLQGNVERSLNKSSSFQVFEQSKWTIIVGFESNKQTQKCYVTEWVRRNAVIREGALPLFRKLTAVTIEQSDPTFSCGHRLRCEATLQAKSWDCSVNGTFQQQ